MSKIFSADEVIKIARLSELELTEKEIKNFVIQFRVILDYFELLEKSEITEVEKKSVDRNLNIDREDRVLNSPVSPEHFSQHLGGRFFKVPRIIDQVE